MHLHGLFAPLHHAFLLAGTGNVGEDRLVSRDPEAHLLDASRLALKLCPGFRPPCVRVSRLTRVCFPVKTHPLASLLEHGTVALEPLSRGGGFAVVRSAVGQIVGAPHGVAHDAGISRLG